MKKVLITVLFVCTTAVVCSALPNFGVKAGVNFSKFSVSKNAIEYSFQPGFDLGLFARFKFNKWYLQPEFVYSYQSSKAKESQVVKYAHSHNLNVPLLLGYKLIDVKMTNVRIFLGPEFNYVLSESTDVNLRNPANIMGSIGLGLDIAMLTLDFKYGYAFNKALKDDKIGDVSFNSHNNVFSIHLGWKFL
jgi:hypothetical protein